MLEFCPHDIGAKETGRIATCKALGLRHKETAPFFKEATSKNFQRHYNSFIDAFPTQAKAISNRRQNGVGPGEMVAWFLFDNVTIGGANAACDITIDGVDFAEMKAGSLCKSKNSLDDFKLSRDQDPSVAYIVNALAPNKNAVVIDYEGRARDANDNPLPPYGSREFIEQVDQILAEKRKTAIDSLYREKIIENWKNLIFSEYLDGKRMALIQTDTLKMRFFGYLSKDMVGLYRIHRNQPWARVYLQHAESYNE